MNKLQSNVLVVDINGKHAASVGVRRSGNGSVIVHFCSKERRPHQSVSAVALEVDQRETFYFFHYLEERRLKVGDVVTITVHASGSVPRIKPETKETKALRQRRYGGRSARKAARH